ncbi:TPA: phage antirepressor KilAC domain-containing protein [Clostridioides difficile]|uniref:phage antirepressor KilAC domain-containing protein n=2 Tax=Clostridioides difficile TaxID=1496 RepID=UPI00093B302A|nr:phage antirepressor KilAC domain-containing protein [Clostridioides difficile]EII6798178.1 phage antirepressor KilAC domain-containing protein [Clostridioides difficile]MBY1073674.1 phage antirepressor KilAC domain-containing protein [Clostridioides difficile]MCX4251568.1 phage antirepressor KilAC domain-containing protein [Clostridioides difficile]HBF1854928.1 phage antirepressor KilAC domain-containing protein [Clostridioides difficile]HBF2215295.1 phage antirepressor KilAC domain-contain
MNNLTIIKQNNKYLVESREVAELIEKDHNQLLRSIRGYISVLEQSAKLHTDDFFIESTYKNENNQKYSCYLLTKKGCDMVANKMTGEKGIIFTAIYVTKFEEMERELKEQQPKLPTTYKEALQQLLIEVEEKEQLQLENQEKDKVIQLQQPKVLFADSVASSDNSILVGELAKLLRQNGIDTGQNRLFDWLRNNGYLIKRKGEDYNTPTQKSVDLGVIETKEGTRVHPDGHTSITKTPKITGKGQIYFINKFKKNNQISMLG